jgi:hypothetical protein
MPTAETAQRKARNMNTPTQSNRRTARVVGILILAAFLTYGIGSAIATSIAATPEHSALVPGNALFTGGAVLMVANSAVVIGIGVLMYPVLRTHNQRVAHGYIATRIFEATFLTVGALSLLSVPVIGEISATSASPELGTLLESVALADNLIAYNVAMAGLGFGSLFFCALLFRSRLVPRFLAAWGFIGYAAFATGCVLELFGFSGAGMIAVVPGGLFEVFFGTWLIIKGFSNRAPLREPAGTGGTLVASGTDS